jgi:hypothetical protein
MMGGIMANNSSGMCCGVTENAYRTVHSMVFILPNGYTLDTGAPEAARIFENEQPHIAQGLLELKQRMLSNADLTERVRRRYQMKNNNGYLLNAFLDFDLPLDILIHLLIGSEGTLGFIAEGVLHTLPDYSRKYTGQLYFNNIQDAAAAIHPNDLFRIIRALEVVTLTGRPPSALKAEARRNHEPVPEPVLRFGLGRDRHELYQRIERRVEEMMARGFLDEVRKLLDHGYSPALKPLRAIGYRHMIEHLKGRMILDDAVGCFKRDTRRYAKRQLTWFRHETGLQWHYVEGSAFIEQALGAFIERIEGAWAKVV